MTSLRCPYCGVVLDAERHVKHEVDCPYCHSTFVPRRKGINRLLQTLLIMAILSSISLTVLVIVGAVNPQSGASFGLLALGLFGVVVALWFGGRSVYMLLVWRDPDLTEESLDLSRFAPEDEPVGDEHDAGPSSPEEAVEPTYRSTTVK